MQTGKGVRGFEGGAHWVPLAFLLGSGRGRGGRNRRRKPAAVVSVGVEDDAWGGFRLDSLRLVVVGDGAELLVCSVWRGAVAKVVNVKLLVL
jgi:hypothetical protein